ncbi:hypothetical protein [Serinibacter arcticus]|uniref:hypothetical protein n=1 Tax=Serinibacter arcticus TaxID=1655435 RepID=UPI001092AB8C|nr:hypothetical protein [Serinibacter arcticus]
MNRFPEPPALDPEVVRGLVRYAQNVVKYFEREAAEAQARGLDSSMDTELVAGWKFVSTAIAESYDTRG